MQRVQSSPIYKIRVLFSGAIQQIGWFIYWFGLVFALVFVGNADFSFIHFRGEIVNMPGVVLGTEETGSSEGDIEVVKTYFAFTDADGRTYEGASYATGEWLDDDSQVTIEYPKGKPQHARIQGFRSAQFGMGVVFVLIFPLTGFIMLVAGLSQGVKRFMLVGGGCVTTARLSGKEATGTTINERRVYALTFAYEVDGQSHTTVCKTHMPEHLEDDAEELLIYKESDPSFAEMFDDLPGHPSLDESGRLRPADGGTKVLGVLILPLLTMSTHLIHFLLMLGG